MQPEELMRQAAELQAQANEILAIRKAEKVELVKAMMVEHGIMPSDLFPSKKPRIRPTVGKARYRDPATGATWTGKGRKPAWVHEHLRHGGVMDQVAIAL